MFGGFETFFASVCPRFKHWIAVAGPAHYSDPKRMDVVVRQHRDILAALRSGNAHRAGACARAEAHLTTSLLHRLKGFAACPTYAFTTASMGVAVFDFLAYLLF